MSVLPLIIVSTLAAGGPAASGHARPDLLSNTSITVRAAAGGRVAAAGSGPRLGVRLRRGAYRVEAALFLHGPEGEPERCETRTFTVRGRVSRGAAPTRIAIYCEIK